LGKEGITLPVYLSARASVAAASWSPLKSSFAVAVLMVKKIM